MDRREAGGQGDRFEPSPTTTAGKIRFYDRRPGSVAPEARTFARLKLEQLCGAHPAARRAPHPELPVGACQQDSGCRSVKQLHTTPSQQLTDLFGVPDFALEARQVHEATSQLILTSHLGLSRHLAGAPKG